MKSLPGFLRRSIRADSDDDLDVEEHSVSSNKDGDESVIIDGSSVSQPHENGSQGAATTIASVSSRASVPPTLPLSPTSPLDHCQSSEVAQIDDMLHRLTRSGSSEGRESEFSQIEKARAKTYRETQFEKTFTANVVSMNDLKTLAWNGIPVRFRLDIRRFFLIPDRIDALLFPFRCLAVRLEHWRSFIFGRNPGKCC